MWTKRLCLFWDEGDKYESVKTTSVPATDVKLNISSNASKKYGLLRRISQKFQQVCLNNPSAFAIGMIVLTLGKLFVQIFDIITDAIIGNLSWLPLFRNSYRLMNCSIELVRFGGKILWSLLFLSFSLPPHVSPSGYAWANISTKNPSKVHFIFWSKWST